MESKNIVEFVKQISLGGQVEKLYLEPCPEGTRASIKNSTHTIFLVGILSGLQIKESLCIKNSKDFISALSWVGGDIILEKVENRLFISSTKNGKVRSQEIGLISEEYAKENYLEKMPALEFEGSTEVESADLKDMASAWSKLGERHINITVKDNKLTFKAAGDTDNTKIELPVEYYDCEGYFGAPFVDVVNVLKTEKVNLFMSKEKALYPLKIVSRTDESLISYIVAPKEIEKEPIEEPKVETEPVSEDFK